MIAGFMASAALVVAGCGGGYDDPTPTAGTTSTTATQQATSPTATSPAATASETAPVDGTVAPQNPGAKDPVTTKSNPDPLTGQALLKDVRMGVHPENGGWERIVFEFEGGLPPADVRYVTSESQCGSGQPMALAGSAVLRVRFSTAAAHNDAGQVTFGKQTVPGPGNTIVEAKQSCDFEAVLAWAMGLKAQQNFKVTTLQNPPRLVIDVKQ
jgi:hypothetical protein